MSVKLAAREVGGVTVLDVSGRITAGEGSNTFRQASTFSSANHALDPENEAWWRWRPRRLEAEAIHDNLLAVAGMLDRTIGGPSVAPQTSGPQRRSVYLRRKRRNLPEALTKVYQALTG